MDVLNRSKAYRKCCDKKETNYEGLMSHLKLCKNMTRYMCKFGCIFETEMVTMDDIKAHYLKKCKKVQHICLKDCGLSFDRDQVKKHSCVKEMKSKTDEMKKREQKMLDKYKFIKKENINLKGENGDLKVRLEQLQRHSSTHTQLRYNYN